MGAPKRITAVEEILRLLRDTEQGFAVIRTGPPAVAPLGDDDMFFVDDSAPGDPLRMRLRDYLGALGYYATIGASRGDADHDSYLDLRPDHAELGAFDNDTGTYVFIIPQGGSLVTVSSLLWEADVDGTEDESKHRMEGGWGLVLPALAADPDPGASEGRQIYYNTVSNTIRWYNGSVWADVGSSASAITAVAELNANQSTTPFTQAPVDFDTLRDSAGATIGSLPAGLGLSYSAGIFTASEDGVWLVTLGVKIVAAPGVTGSLLLSTPDWGYSPQLNLAASGNPSPWYVEKTIPIKLTLGDEFKLLQGSAGASPVDLIDGYASMVITRIASSLT